MTGTTARLLRAWPVALALLTLALGMTVAVSWMVFGGTAAFRGPDRVLAESWPAIYGSQALLAALVGLVLARTRGDLGRWELAMLIAGAWLGELAVLTLGGTLLANELDPNVAWFFWLMGTGGPIQPAAAVLGALIGWLAFRA
jgi:hypothetical protein